MKKNVTERYHLLDYLIEGCQIINHKYEYIYLNEAVVKHSHFTENYLLGKKMIDCYPGIDQTKMYKNLEICMTYGLPKKMVNEFTYPDQSKGWFELIMQKIPEGVLIMSNDITKLITSEQELLVKNNRLKALRKIDIEILRSTPLKEIVSKIVTTIRKHTPSINVVHVFLYDNLVNQLDCFYSTENNLDHEKHNTISLSDELLTMFRHQDEQHFLIDIKKLNDNTFTRREFIRSYEGHFIIPLKANYKLFGIIEFFQIKEEALSKDDLNFISDLSKQTAIAIEKNNLFEDLILKNQALHNAYEGIIEGWSRALEIRDFETKGHTLRVTDIACDFARYLNYTDFNYKTFRYGCLMHDLGKIIVPESILLKPGPLNDDEWEIMKQHPVHAKELLMSISYLHDAITVPYCHHEWYDGSGYPQGLSKENIPLYARIFAFADVYDALTTDRVYSVDCCFKCS